MVFRSIYTTFAPSKGVWDMKMARTMDYLLQLEIIKN